MEYNYKLKEKIDEVKVGDKYRYLELNDNKCIEVGESIIYFDDPDILESDTDDKYTIVSSRNFVGYVQGIYKTNDGRIQVTMSGLGRIDVEDVNFDVSDYKKELLEDSNHDTIVEERYALTPDAPDNKELKKEYDIRYI